METMKELKNSKEIRLKCLGEGATEELAADMQEIAQLESGQKNSRT